ncbi:hypothetical protein DPMN_020900 [Dreissena polymorpha]|uniref:Uncharacterized protein n=1 Tax=Dreissena polymorpha TaxID=45954 RepID=A0A9D4NL57_DREPO|nr:hypothetical protein DPMN_020900 [Dreissena polymorpha]
MTIQAADEITQKTSNSDLRRIPVYKNIECTMISSVYTIIEWRSLIQRAPGKKRRGELDIELHPLEPEMDTSASEEMNLAISLACSKLEIIHARNFGLDLMNVIEKRRLSTNQSQDELNHSLDRPTQTHINGMSLVTC